MVSSLLVDALADPSSVIDSLYDDYQNGSKNETPDFPSFVSKHFSSVFKSADAMEQITLLTPSSFASSSPSSSSPHTRPALVHFRGMVQDTSPSPEVYLASHAGKTYGWGLDLSRTSTDVDERDSTGTGLFGERNENLAERTVVWAVSIPGESEWSVERAGGGQSSDVVENLAAGVRKASLAESSQVAFPSRHKYPIPEQAHVALRVKLYETRAESLKPTNLVSFVGILAHEELESDDYSHTPSQPGSSSTFPQTTPVLHVLFYRPIIDGVIPLRYPHAAHSDALREELVRWIATEGLGGDTEAAQWVLLACLSNVQSRSPPLLPLSLTLSAFPRPSSTSSPSSLSHILSLLLSLHSNLPLSLDYLNRHSFEPESKHEDLHAGVLQLPPKTVILVSDSGMKEGKLEQRGLQNVQALQDVIARQTLRYNFPYSNFALPTDVNFIVIAEGKKCPFCETTVSIPLVPNLVESNHDLYKAKGSIQLPPLDQLNAFRDFIASARSGKVTISEDISKSIQESFVNERQLAGSKKFGPDDLVRRMTVAKLVALSRHQDALTEETWKEAVALDRAREKRLA